MSKNVRYTLKDRLEQVDEEIVFDVIREELPRMQDAIREILSRY